MKFVFDIFDSNNDGKVNLKDIEIILLHIPIFPIDNNSITFKDRLISRLEIYKIISNIS